MTVSPMARFHNSYHRAKSFLSFPYIQVGRASFCASLLLGLAFRCAARRRKGAARIAGFDSGPVVRAPRPD